MSTTETFQCPECYTKIPECNRYIHPINCQPKPSPSSPSTTNDSIRNIQQHIPTINTSSTSTATITEPEPQQESESPTHESIPTAECEYCDLPVSLSLLDAHATQCGSTTTECPVCTQRVRRRDMYLHIESGCNVYATTDEDLIPAEESTSLLPRMRGIESANSTSLTENWVPVAAMGAAAVAVMTIAALSPWRRRR